MTAQRLRPNPPLNRFKYIAKTYGQKQPDVVLDTFFSLADTVGIENPVREFPAVARWDRLRSRMAHEARDGFGGSFVATGSSRNRQQREILRQLLEELEDEPRMKQGRESDALWPWLARELVRMKKEGLVREGGVPSWMAWSAEVEGKGSAIALWQRQNRIDLGQWRIPAVLEALEDFELEGRDVPQGEVVYAFDDGWTVQRLVDPEQLKVEGEVMQHCVGTYCPTVASGETIIYSLRDPAGKPHVTMEMRPGFKRFIQVQGKQNAPPLPQYQERVDEFAEAQGLEDPGLNDKERTAAFDAGYAWGEELWDQESRGVKFAISSASEEAPAHPEYYQVIEESHGGFEGVPEDYYDAGLSEDIEERAREGADSGWAAGYQQAQEYLESVIQEATSWAQDEIDEGVQVDEIDLEFIVSEAFGRSVLYPHRDDTQYVIEQVLAEIE